MSNKKYPRGKGPYTFKVDESLSPSGSGFTLDLVNKRFNNRPGFFKPYLPMDFLEVTNLDADNAVVIHFNNQDEGYVTPNTSESFTQQTFSSIRVENIGSTTIAANDVILQPELTSYGSDSEAMDNAGKGFLGRAASDVIPGF